MKIRLAANLVFDSYRNTGYVLAEDAPGRHYHRFRDRIYSLPFPYVYYLWQVSRFNQRYGAHLKAVGLRIQPWGGKMDEKFSHVPMLNFGYFRPCYPGGGSKLTLKEAIANDYTAFWDSGGRNDDYHYLCVNNLWRHWCEECDYDPNSLGGLSSRVGEILAHWEGQTDIPWSKATPLEMLLSYKIALQDTKLMDCEFEEFDWTS